MRSTDESNTADTGRVVVAVDGSPSSIWALRHGARIASALGLRLEAVTVWHQPDLYEGSLGGPLDPGADTDAMQADAVTAAFGTSLPAGFERTLIEGATVATLLRESRSAEMLVLGSRGRGGFAGLLLGSVSAACAAHATCAVLVCHADIPGRPSMGRAVERGSSEEHVPPVEAFAARTGRAGAASRPGSFDEAPPEREPAPARARRRFEESDQDEVVVRVDGTAASTGALRQGARFAESLGLPLRAICASDAATSPTLDARAVLTEASRQVFGASPPAWFHASVRAGAPAVVLGQASDRARMLLIGNSAAGGPPTSALSMSAAIAARASCPIVIFHATHAVDSFDGAIA